MNKRNARLEFATGLYESISALPNIVKWPGLIIIGLLLFGAVTRFLTLRWISAVTNVVYALIVALVLHHYGKDIASFVSKQTATEAASEYGD